MFGWPVRGHDLVLGAGIGAAAVPRARAGQVVENLGRQGCRAAALSVPPVVIFLAEADVLPGDLDGLPADVRVLTSGTAIPLPGAPGPARWLVPPDPRQRWLPSLTAVLAAARVASYCH
ncbi:hypothetical protein [Amycolatopsis thermoflava]|uniref:Uncharacterized protein n=1 Tax=Amycolatopsis thermoflava TaxID=84480 RepID=A0A3N2H590_9PSEU|nr:hypothetical protein [Amycolatopsis thermoflava]ROS44074.1 hypothetical protein EDD35_6501 [Amycolatopsis thermoflava]